MLDSSLKHLVFFKTFNSEFSCNKVWFNDNNSKALEMMCFPIKQRDRIFIKIYGFLSLVRNVNKNLSKNIEKIVSEKYKLFKHI